MATLCWIKPKVFSVHILFPTTPGCRCWRKSGAGQTQSQSSHSFSYQNLRDILSQNLHWSYLIATDGATHQGKIVSGTMACFEFLTVSFSRLRIKTAFLHFYLIYPNSAQHCRKIPSWCSQTGRTHQSPCTQALKTKIQPNHPIFVTQNIPSLLLWLYLMGLD